VINFSTDLGEELGSTDGVPINVMFEFESEAITERFGKRCRQALAKNGKLLMKFNS
jgi:hypothetical protein